MIVVEYLVYDDQPDINPDGEYVGVLPGYGSVTHVETNNPTALDCHALPSERVWIVPGTIESAEEEGQRDRWTAPLPPHEVERGPTEPVGGRMPDGTVVGQWDERLRTLGATAIFSGD
jgi:hypothetical protein